MRPNATLVALRAALAPLALCAIAGWSQAQTNISGPIYDGSGGPLVSGTVYMVTGNISVPAGETLTVQDDVIVKFHAGRNLAVDGTLLVNGLSATPSYFTSYRDDSVGGDSNGDGTSYGAWSDWEAIHFAATSGASALDWAELRFAGYNSYASVEVTSADVTLRNCVFSTCYADGIDLNGSTAQPTVTDCSFQGNRTYAVTGATVESLSGFTGNTCASNGYDAIRVTVGSMSSDATVQAANCVGGAVRFQSDFTIPIGVTLTLDEGVVIKPDNARIWTVGGTLITTGTIGNPVVFTSYRDDDYGGDSNGDGPTNGSWIDWSHILFESTAGASNLDHTLFRYSGYNFYCTLELDGADITLTNSTIQEGYQSGLDLRGSSAKPTVSDCSFEDHRVYAVEGATLDAIPGFSGNTASGNGSGDCIWISVPSPTADVTIVSDNGIDSTLVFGADCNIPAGTKVILGEGVIVKSAHSGNRITVDGALITEGSASSPVVFTSFRDDDYGGDTNSDGASSGGSTDWEGLQFESTSGDSVLEHTIVRWAGYNYRNGITLRGANITLRGTTIRECYSGGLTLQGMLARPTVEGCSFLNNGGYAVGSVPVDAVPGFRDNQASGNSGGSYIDVTPASPAADVTLDPENAINGALVMRQACTVPAGVTMNLRPGTILKFYGGAPSCTVHGSLNLQGTAGQRVVLTSLRDDDHGGDTNGDGPSTGGAIDWAGLYYPADAEASSMENVVVRWAGYNYNPTIRIDSPLVSARSIRAENPYQIGIQASALSGDAENWVARGCSAYGIYLTGGSFDVVHATACWNNYGLYKTGAYTGTVRNSISWDNTTDYSGFAAGELDHCDGSAAHDGTNGCINVDPQFVDAPNDDFRLQLGSPCVDTADYAAALGVVKDWDENSRILDPNLTGTMLPDMGAFEHAIWTMTTAGSLPRIGGRVDFQVDGPAGSSVYMLGMLDGSVVDSPFGIIAAGNTSLTVLDTVAVGDPYRINVPDELGILGVWFGVQTRTTPAGSTTVGNITNLFRASILPRMTSRVRPRTL